MFVQKTGYDTVPLVPVKLTTTSCDHDLVCYEPYNNTLVDCLCVLLMPSVSGTVVIISW